MKTVNLNDLSGIPKEFIMQLSQFDQIFEEVDYLSDLDNIDALQCLIREINEYCLNNEVIGFHYTRAYQDDISRLGLLSRTGKVIRADFLKKHRSFQ